eukprot:4653151-Lingulodinium_polyedra.AAC.1
MARRIASSGGAASRELLMAPSPVTWPMTGTARGRTCRGRAASMETGSSSRRPSAPTNNCWTGSQASARVSSRRGVRQADV